MINKTQLIEQIADKGEMTKKEAEKGLNAFIKVIENSLCEGEKIQITGFGTFEVRDRAARQGRNPQKPEEIIEIPASKAPAFKAGKKLKEIVNSL